VGVGRPARSPSTAGGRVACRHGAIARSGEARKMLRLLEGHIVLNVVMTGTGGTGKKGGGG